MLINKSMFPIQAGYSAISRMQGELGRLQTQLGTGEKAGTLAEMGADRTVSLALRDRLTKLDSYSSNIETVNLRLSFLDVSFSALSKIKAETRTAATPTSFGENNLVMTTLQKNSESRLGLVIDNLNANVGGRYLMGGNATSQKPVASLDAIMNGQGTQDGFKTVLNERNRADLGADVATPLSTLGLPRTSVSGSGVAISSRDLDTLGFGLTSISATGGAIATSGPTANTGSDGKPDSTVNLGVQFAANPASGDTVSVGVKLPNGSTSVVELKAVTGTPGVGEFAIGATAAQTAANFETALGGSVGALSAPLKQGRLDVAVSGNEVALTKPGAASPFGYNLSAASSTGSSVTIAPGTTTVSFGGPGQVGDSVTFGVTMPDGTASAIKLKAVEKNPGVGEYAIGANADETAANFAGALSLKLDANSRTELTAASTYAAADDFFTADGVAKRVGGNPETATGYDTIGTKQTVKWYAGEVGGSDNPRLAATAQVDDATRVGYGVRANENGLIEMVRTLAAMSVQDYSVSDPTSKGRFSAMVDRQNTALSTASGGAAGSVEVIAMELGVVKASVGSATERNKAYGGQLKSLLSDTETVPFEQTAMELLAVKTRLEASYQVTASVSQLSLVNYLR